MSNLQDRTRALLAGARAIDAKEFRGRLKTLGLSLIRTSQLVRKLVRANLDLDRRVRLLEKQMREK